MTSREADKVILLTSSYSEAADGRPLFSLNKVYADGVAESGRVPILALSSACAEEYAKLADRLVLTGGLDVVPSLYGEEPHPTSQTDPARDELELAVLRAFIDAGKPIFGICRGLQLINVFFGGTLWQHLPESIGENHEGGTEHQVEIVPDSVLDEIFGNETIVNSYHHQAVHKLGEGLRATAYSKIDGKRSIVEAFEHETLNIHAVQWHPERDDTLYPMAAALKRIASA